MKNAYLIILFLIPIVAFSQMRERLNSTDLERYQLTGKVKEVIHEEYEPRFSNDSTYTLERYDFLSPHNYKLEFNHNGNLNTLTELRKKKDSLKTATVWKYKYDSNNRILQEKRISFQYSKDTMIFNYKYMGDSIININQLDKTYNILYYTYKQKGNIEYLNHANSDSSYITKKLFVYDKQNRLTRYEDYEDKNYIQDLRIYTYKDTISKNKFTEIIVWTKYNSSSYNEFEYDNNGNVVVMKIGNFIGSEPSINRYEYIYDDKGNWIEKKHIGWRGKLSTVFRRKIEYYE